MFRGSPGLGGTQLSEIAAQLGGQMDAYTTEDTTTYYFTVPADNLGITLKIGALRMAGVDDSSGAWQKERGAIEQEVARDNSDPLYVLQTRAQRHIFAGTPYAHTGLGTIPSFNKTTASMIKQFHDTWYAPNNALLVVSGDVHPKRVLAEVRRLYGSIPEKSLPAKAKITLSAVRPAHYSSKTDQPYGMVAYVFRMPGYRSASYPTVELLAQVLDSRRGAISALAYDGQAIASGFSYNALVHAGFGYAWAAFPPGGDGKRVADQLKVAVADAVSHLSSDLLAAQKRKVILGSDLSRTSVSGLAAAWSDAIALEGIASPGQDAARLQKVGIDALRRAAEEYLDFSHAVTLALEPTGGSRPEQGGQAFGKPESFGSTPSKVVKLPAWASRALAKLPSPKPLFHPSDYRLPNGIRLIVQPIDHSKAVSLFGGVRTDESLEASADKQGVGSLLDSLYAWGPRGMTRSQFEAKMDAIGAAYSVGSDFALQVLPAYFSQGVRLLSEDLLRPALPAHALASQKRLFVQELTGRLHSPLFQFERSVEAALLPEGDPSLRMPTPKSVGSITRSDVLTYAEKVMRPDETTIVVMGDVKPARVKAVIEAYLGGWQAHGPKPDLSLPAIPLSVAKQVFVRDSFRRQDEVLLAETIDSSYNDPGRYALELGNGFLGGDLFASPLYRQLRVDRGLVYHVGSSANFARSRASFQISFGAYPDKVQEAKQLALKELRLMASKPLTPQELHLAKASALRKIELTNQSLGDVAGSWLSYASEGLPLNRLYVTAHRFERLSAAEVQEAFKKYIDPSRLSTFILGRQAAK